MPANPLLARSMASPELSRSWCSSYLKSWCRCVCSPAEVRQPVWATRIIKVGALQAVSSRGTFGFLFIASGSSQVHPSFLPPKCLPCGCCMQTEAAGLHRLCSKLLQLGKVRSLQQISLLYHFWWFCFSKQTLTDTNGCLCVPWREFRILMNLCSQSNLTFGLFIRLFSKGTQKYFWTIVEQNQNICENLICSSHLFYFASLSSTGHDLFLTLESEH